MSPVIDITIAGAGPAGLALAASAARRGARVVVVDPEPEQAWPNRYGAWEHDLDGLDVPVAQRWSAPYIDTGSGRTSLPGAYVALDRAALRRSLLQTLSAHGGELRAGRVTRATHEGSDDGRPTRVLLADGQELDTHRLVDATGRGALIRRPRPPRAFQAALGWLVRADHPWSVDQAAFMDFSTDHLEASERGGPPTFLYALPVDADHVFVEETSLAAAPAVSLDLLQARLERRLQHAGVVVHETLEVERCLFAMDAPAPEPGPVLAVGAAAGWVHPATGYQVTRALRRADPVADALVSQLHRPLSEAMPAAWRAVWPSSERRTRALHDLGLGLLLDLEPEAIRSFFTAFFAIPAPAWRSYLDATSPPAAVAYAMTRVFTALPTALQRRVVRHVLGRGRVELLRAVSPVPSGGAS